MFISSVAAQAKFFVNIADAILRKMGVKRLAASMFAMHIN
jgi:hypothetical protein